jgi:hypothetical protein
MRSNTSLGLKLLNEVIKAAFLFFYFRFKAEVCSSDDILRNIPI